MAHLPRFSRRKKEVAGPPLITNDLAGSGKPAQTTPPSGEPPQPESPARHGPFQKLSPFKVFQRSSAKRARDSPPASLPHSPAAASAPVQESVDGRPVSPLSLRMDQATEDGGQQLPQQQQQQHQAAQKLPPKHFKRPTFLNLSEPEIEAKFGELMWLERIRIQRGMENEASANPHPEHRWARVKGPHLRKLDRYMNIQPWHNHRIKLQVPAGKLDYVNASPIILKPTPIPGRPAREADRYIAMQGPKQQSTDHVWRMIVEQVESPGVIVMLTETHEGHIEKCFPYFPRSAEDPPLEINERDEFGDGFRATVRCEGLEDTPAGDAIELRKLVIRVHPPQISTKSRSVTPEPAAAPAVDADLDVKMKSPSGPDLSSPPSPVASPEGGEERVIYHFLYKKWPDFGVPALEDLDSFFTLMQLSREKNAHPNNPRIVHCSAGVGRSGTFIALEHLMRELDAGVLEDWDEKTKSLSSSPTVSEGGSGRGGGEWDRDGFEGDDIIFDTVNALREQRKMMVQAEGQYLFIYEVMRKLWVDKYGEEEEEEGEEGEKANGEVLGVDGNADKMDEDEGGDGERSSEKGVDGSSRGAHYGEPKKKRVEVEFDKGDAEVEVQVGGLGERKVTDPFS